MHGIVESGNGWDLCNRNLFDREWFVTAIRAYTGTFEPLEIALSGGGIAITIDDATVAAADAARALAEQGCPVTLFINPFNVDERTTYHFARLNALCDALIGRGMKQDEAEDNRLQMKRDMARLKTERDRHSFIDERAGRFGISNPPIPHHLRTVTLAELHGLRDMGVDIGNHGWTHGDYVGLPREQYADQVRRGRNWLGVNGFGFASSFAVPYGRSLPVGSIDTDDLGTILLAEDRLSPGVVGPNIVNRWCLDAPMMAPLSFSDRIDAGIRASQLNVDLGRSK